MKSKKHTRLAVILSAVLIIAIGGIAIALGAGRGENSLIPMTMNNVYKEPHFSGVVTEVHENYILVHVNEEEDARRSSDLITVSLDVRLKDSVQIWFVGDEVIVYYDGTILETYPAQVDTVYAILMKDTSISLNTITLEDLRELAAKGDGLSYDDMQHYRGMNASSQMGGHNPTVYGVEGGYRLIINYVATLNPESGIMSTALESICESGGSGIDIRYNDVDEFIRTHPSHPADTVPLTSYTPREWINRQNLDYSLTTAFDLMLDEFPGVMFSYTPEKLTATDKNGLKELFGGTDGFIFGGYIDNLYLADLNGDGLPEFCGTTNYGWGFGDLRVIVYDYANDKRYVLSDRGTYDYFLQMENGQIEVIQTEPIQTSAIPNGVGSLAIINNELVVFGIDRTPPETEPKPISTP